MATSTSLALGNAPRLRPPSVRAHSRSPSRSPIRKTQFAAHERDPLLGNLSPESILQAFSAIESPSTDSEKSQDILRASIASASTAERDLAIKAALAAQKVQQWLAEISSWHWPDHKASAQGAGFLQPIHRGNGEQGAVAEQEDIYMGSLRAEVVRKYERCLEEIKDGLEGLDVRDLKEHVLDAHIPSRSRPSTRNGPSEVTTSLSGYGHLGDLTAVITATILQTLPYLAELNMLISIWDVRIAVLLSVPELVQRLQTTRAAVEEALREVRAENAGSAYNKSQFDFTREKLQREVSSLGVRFDKALDLLEGREDRLPDLWIREMDTIESNFANWVVEAERRALNVLWRRQNGQHLAAQQSSQTVRDAVVRPSAEPAGQMTSSTGSPSAVDHAAQKDVDEHRSQTKHVLLPEHPALEAFSHRPVRKASVKHSLVDSNSPYTDLTSSQRSAADEEGNPIARTTTPRTEVVPPENTGSSASQTAPEVPIVSHMSQQQGRLADLIPLNNEEAADDYQRDFMGSNYSDTYTPGRDGGVQHQPFPFLSQVPERPHKQSGTKPPLKLDLTSASHRRGVSEASAAGSAFSEAFSEISNAEIVDATTTQVLASPKITLVDNPFGPGQDDPPATAANARPRVQSMHILGKDAPATEPVVEGHNRSKSLTLTAIPSRILANDTGQAYHKRSIDDLEMSDDGPSRRQMLHRASTASIEVIPKGQVRRIDSNRKSSREQRLVSPIDTEGNPSDALTNLTSASSIRSNSSAATAGLTTPTPGDVRWRDGIVGHYTAPLQPLSYTGGVARSREETLDIIEPSFPDVDRKTRRRQSLDLDNPEPLTDVDPLSVSDVDDAPVSLPSTFSPFEARDHKLSASPSKSLNSEATLEAKIKDILINLPTRIRLTSDSDSSGSPMQQSSSNSTRSSTPTPCLTLSPARQDRSNRRTHTSNSEVKVYHLIRSGQPRDAPPTKLHVRLVGENGERVMVRVGGGWADLAEYLREYSLHHGTRTVKEGRFEVANLPSSGVKASDTNGSSPIIPSLNVAKTRSASRADTGFDFGPLPLPINAKARRSATAPIPAERKGPRSSSPTLAETPAVRPPPVPVIPTSFRQKSSPNLSTNSAVTIESPTVATEVRSRGQSLSTSTFVTSSPSTPLSAYHAQTRNSVTTTHPIITTTSTMSTPTSTTSSPSYTPLGAAGPKGGIKNSKTRAATFGSSALSSPENEAWVQGMVGKARQASGQSNSSHVTTITGPNNTTTTSTSIPNNRRVSTAANTTSISTPPAARASSALASTSITASPGSHRGTQTPSSSPATKDANRSESAEKPRSKSSLGIRRVFLRSKKPDKGE